MKPAGHVVQLVEPAELAYLPVPQLAQANVDPDPD